MTELIEDPSIQLAQYIKSDLKLSRDEITYIPLEVISDILFTTFKEEELEKIIEHLRTFINHKNETLSA